MLSKPHCKTVRQRDARSEKVGGVDERAGGGVRLQAVLVRKRSKALGLLGSDWKKRRVALYGRGNALAPRNVLLVLSEPASDEVTEELELDAASAGEARRSEVGGFVCVEVPNPRRRRGGGGDDDAGALVFRPEPFVEAHVDEWLAAIADRTVIEPIRVWHMVCFFVVIVVVEHHLL